MTTPPGYAGNPIDTEGVSGNTGAAPSGTQNRASNAETATPSGAAFGGGPTGTAQNPNTAVSGTTETSGAGQGSSTSFTPVDTSLSGTLDTRTIGWPVTPGVTQAYRAADLKIGYLDGMGARDTTWTDRPLTDGTVRPNLMTNYPGTLESANIGAPSGPVGTGVPVAPGSAPTVVAGAGLINVFWTTVADPSNAPVRGYVVMSSTGGTAYASRTDRTVAFDTVVPNVGYTFRVAARNDNGLGPFSVASGSATAWNAEENDSGKPGGLWGANTANPIYRPNGTVVAGSGLAGTPGAPTSPVLTQGATGVLNAAWTAPVGGKVVSYTVVLSTGQSKSVSSATVSTSFSGLTPTTATTFRVTAVGSVGSTQSAASASVNVP